MKLVWRVSPKPTGQYRSFEQRGWPFAAWIDSGGESHPACHIICEDGYYPPDVKIGNHKPLKIRVMDYRERSHGGNCPWTAKMTKAEFKTLDEAKAWFKEHGSKYAPKALTD